MGVYRPSRGRGVGELAGMGAAHATAERLATRAKRASAIEIRLTKNYGPIWDRAAQQMSMGTRKRIVNKLADAMLQGNEKEIKMRTHEIDVSIAKTLIGLDIADTLWNRTSRDKTWKDVLFNKVVSAVKTGNLKVVTNALNEVRAELNSATVARTVQLNKL